MTKIRQWLGEPLVHFFILGLALFVLFDWLNEDSFQSPDEILVDSNRINVLASQFERTWQRPPTPDELAGIVDAWIREEILFREGVALGLDSNDPVVRQRIAMKMRFMADSLVDDQVTDEDLEAYFADNMERYRIDPRYSLRQVFFDPDRHGSDLKRILEAGRAELAADAGAAVGDATVLPAALDDESRNKLARIFGSDFAAALDALPVNEWSGPVISAYGVHLVYIDARVPTRYPALEEVRGDVENDLLAVRANEAEETLLAVLRDRYTVRRLEETPASAE